MKNKSSLTISVDLKTYILFFCTTYIHFTWLKPKAHRDLIILAYINLVNEKKKQTSTPRFLEGAGPCERCTLQAGSASIWRLLCNRADDAATWGSQPDNFAEDICTVDSWECGRDTWVLVCVIFVYLDSM